MVTFSKGRNSKFRLPFLNRLQDAGQLYKQTNEGRIMEANFEPSSQRGHYISPLANCVLIGANFTSIH